MKSEQSICYLLAVAVSLALIVYGYMCILKKQQAAENDSQVISRQIRGFAYLSLAGLAFVIGVALCTSMDVDGVYRAMSSVAASRSS